LVTVHLTLNKYFYVGEKLIKKEERKNGRIKSLFKYFNILNETKNLNARQTKEVFQRNNINISENMVYFYKNLFKNTNFVEEMKKNSTLNYRHILLSVPINY
jgi:hypothetical protein